MNKKQLLEILKRVDDDFELKFTYNRELTKDELKSMKYRFPYELIPVNIEFSDIGYSSKQVLFDVVPKQDGDDWWKNVTHANTILYVFSKSITSKGVMRMCLMKNQKVEIKMNEGDIITVKDEPYMVLRVTVTRGKELILIGKDSKNRRIVNDGTNN